MNSVSGPAETSPTAQCEQAVAQTQIEFLGYAALAKRIFFCQDKMQVTLDFTYRSESTRPSSAVACYGGWKGSWASTSPAPKPVGAMAGRHPKHQ